MELIDLASRVQVSMTCLTCPRPRSLGHKYCSACSRQREEKRQRRKYAVKRAVRLREKAVKECMS